jgi:cobalt-precorrin-6B (C15)-methyltransferase
VNDSAKYVVPGLSDESFERGNVPLTKEEIRCLTLSKLRLQEESHLLDIGAGSGGLAVEAALLAKGGQVWAVERNTEALNLIRANCRRFKVENVTIIEGEAPSALEELDQTFDRIVVGGSGGRLEEIIARCRELLVPGGIIVINCIMLETLFSGLGLLKDEVFTNIQYIQAAISRSRELGGGTVLQPLNPVFIISALRGAD